MGSLSLLQGNLPDPGIEPGSPALQADSLPAEPQGKPKKWALLPKSGYSLLCCTIFLVAQMVKNPCNAGDLGSIPRLGNPLDKEMATHSTILGWRIPWTEEPGGL